MTTTRELPRYQSHKVVNALKIAAIEGAAGDVKIIPADEGYGPYPVSDEYVERHRPQPGGYLVAYKDGYLSFSPADAFEEGYTRIGG